MSSAAMAMRTWKAPWWSRPDGYFKSDPSTPRRIEPPSFITIFVASGTSPLLAVRAAVLAMVVPMVSLREEGPLVVLVASRGSESRRRGCGLGSAGGVCGTRVRPQGPDAGGASDGGGAS